MAGRASKPSTSRNDDELIDDELQPVDPPPVGPEELPDSGDVGRVPGASYDINNPSGAINVKNPTGDPSLPFVQEGETGGYLAGKGVTIGAGTSQTQADVDAALANARALGIPEDFIAQFISENGWRDAHRLEEGYFSDAGVEDTRLGGAGGGGGRSSGGGSGSGYNGPFAPPPTSAGWMPTYTAPVFTPPAALDIPSWKEPAAFTYADFERPTLEQARQEPGFAFAMEQGSKALENSAASKGLLRTGGTAKELIGFGQKLGEQNYGNVFNRESDVYKLNRDNAADIYTTKYGAAKDAYKYGVEELKGEYDSLYETAQDDYDARAHGAEAEYKPKQQEAELNFKAAMDQWLEKMRIAGLIEADSD
jgi:hypothetical protein